jgi:hypothetical protein
MVRGRFYLVPEAAQVHAALAAPKTSSARGWQPTKTASSQSLESRQAGLRFSPAFFYWL